MNFQSLTFFKKNKAEPGSYTCRNRFLKVSKNTPLENCMGTRFLPIQEPVPEYIFPVFINFSKWNPVPPHWEPVPTCCIAISCTFDSIHSFSIQPKLTHTNPNMEHTKTHPFCIITTSNNIFPSFLFIY